jgi:hypothetical protein
MTTAEAWVLMITDGNVLEFPPELYVDSSLARWEARRWAACLAGGVERSIREPFEGRIEVGHRDVRLSPVIVPRPWPGGEAWVGTHWTPYRYPDPDAVILTGAQAAAAWARSPRFGHAPAEVTEHVDEMVATFRMGGEEEHYRATMLKCVCRPVPPAPGTRSPLL